MPDVNQYVRRAGVIVAYAPETAGAAGTFVKISNINSDVPLTDSRGQVTVRSFDTKAGDYDLIYSDSRTGSLALTLNLVPTDLGFQALRTDYEAAKQGYLYLAGVDSKGTPTGLTYKLFVTISQFAPTFRMDNVAQVAVTFTFAGVATFTTPTLT